MVAKSILIIYFSFGIGGEFDSTGEAHFLLNSCSQAETAVERVQEQNPILFDRYEIRVLRYECHENREQS